MTCIISQCLSNIGQLATIRAHSHFFVPPVANKLTKAKVIEPYNSKHLWGMSLQLNQTQQTPSD